MWGFARSTRPSRPTFAALALAAAILSAHPAPAAAHDALALESAFVGRIAEFITWPAEAGLQDPDRPFEIAVLGRTPLTARLADHYAGARIAGHPVRVREIYDVDEIGRPHVLFVGPGRGDELEEILAAVGTAPVLVMGDREGLGQRGVAVNLYVMEGHVRFEISRAALKRHHLQASYRLLALARPVDAQHARR